MFSLYKKAHTPWDWHKKIFDRAKKHKLICFSSPFDETAVEFLEKLNVPLYKIASFENNHFPLLKRIAQTKKPIIMSIGLATLKELRESVKFLKKNGCSQLALLKCTSSYPAKPSDLNLVSIQKLRKIFKCEIGFSDHSLGIGAPISAINFGASIIEKHFTIKKNKGVDGVFSSDYEEIKKLKFESKVAWLARGKPYIGPTKNEKKYKKFRRSIYVIKKVKKNELFSESNIKVIRPGLGLHPRNYYSVLGKKAAKDIKEGFPLKKSIIK